MSSPTLPCMATIGDRLIVVHNKNLYVYFDDLNIWHDLRAGEPVASTTAQPKDKIYCLTEGGDKKILSFNSANSAWVTLNVDDHITAITAVGDTVAQLLKNGSIELYNADSSAWDKIDEPKKPAPSAITSDTNGNLYKLYSSGSLYKWNGPNGSGWTKIIDTGVASISAYAGEIFRADQDGMIYQYSNGTWTCIDRDQESTTKVFAGKAGIFEIRPEQVQQYTKNTWVSSRGGKMADMIVGETIVYVKDMQGQFLKRPLDGKWTALPSLPK